MQANDTQKLFYRVLFFYMCAVTLFLTLMPFRFSVNFSDVKWGIWSDAEDIAINIFLFIPLGFLFYLSRFKPVGKFVGYSLIFGLLFSTLIELTQLFLPKRYTTLCDVMMNGVGSWIGGLSIHYLQSFLKQKKTINLRLLPIELPLVNIVYLLIPLIWINSISIGNFGERFWFSLIPIGIGAYIIGEIYRREFENFSLKQFAVLVMLCVGWIFTAESLMLAKRWEDVLVVAALGAAITISTAFRRPVFDGRKVRYEIVVLKRVVPFFLLYLYCVGFYPFRFNFTEWHLQFGLSGIPEDPPVFTIFRLLAYMSALTLLGYMLSQIIARRESEQIAQKTMLALAVIWVPGGVELCRGFHVIYEASVLNFCFGVLASFSGVWIHRLYLGIIRTYLQKKQSLAKQVSPNLFHQMPSPPIKTGIAERYSP
jgi:glycopeptide antibiotics resistance protein